MSLQQVSDILMGDDDKPPNNNNQSGGNNNNNNNNNNNPATVKVEGNQNVPQAYMTGLPLASPMQPQPMRLPAQIPIQMGAPNISFIRKQLPPEFLGFIRFIELVKKKLPEQQANIVTALNGQILHNQITTEKYYEQLKIGIGQIKLNLLLDQYKKLDLEKKKRAREQAEAGGGIGIAPQPSYATAMSMGGSIPGSMPERGPLAHQELSVLGKRPINPSPLAGEPPNKKMNLSGNMGRPEVVNVDTFDQVKREYANSSGNNNGSGIVGGVMKPVTGLVMSQPGKPVTLSTSGAGMNISASNMSAALAQSQQRQQLQQQQQQQQGKYFRSESSYYKEPSNAVLINQNPLRRRVDEIARKLKITKVDEDVYELITLALHERLRTVTEELVLISKKRQEQDHQLFECTTVSNAQASLKQALLKEQELQRYRDAEEKKSKLLQLSANNNTNTNTNSSNNIATTTTTTTSSNSTGDTNSILGNTTSSSNNNVSATNSSGVSEPPPRVISVSSAPKISTHFSHFPHQSDSLAEVTVDSAAKPSTYVCPLNTSKRITSKDALVFIERDIQQNTMLGYKWLVGREMLKYDKLVTEIIS